MSRGREATLPINTEMYKTSVHTLNPWTIRTATASMDISIEKSGNAVMEILQMGM